MRVRPMASRLLLAAITALAGCPTRSPAPASQDDAPSAVVRPRIILFIGDGMGKPHIEAASDFATGSAGELFMQTLPHHADILSASLSGLTDSAASATTMASGALTFNGRIGRDGDGGDVASIIEIAAGLGLATGLVTTTTLPHATPAAFAAHQPSRNLYREIAEDYVLRTRPNVMLGGGASYFGGSDELADLVPMLRAAGYATVDNRDQLLSIDASRAGRVFGAFATGHLPYANDRIASGELPTLPEMTMKAIEVLDRNERGFVLVVEGGRIDHAGHANNIDNVIGDTLEFDATIAQTVAWSRDLEAVTVLVTADHATGGLEVLATAGRGQTPEVGWRWGDHTNNRIDLFALGDGLGFLDGGVFDHRIVFAIMEAALSGRAPTMPPRALLTNGHTAELRYLAAEQTVASDALARGRLNALRVDADERGIGIGIDGLFSWQDSAVVFFIDRDFGAESGARVLSSRTSSGADSVDDLIATLAIDLAIPGFGADFVAVTIDGAESRTGGPIGSAGWRALEADGSPRAVTGSAAINYDDRVREGRYAALARPFSGVEVGIPIERLFPSALPVGAAIAVIAILTSAEGDAISNQALPSRTTSGVTSVCVVELDRDLDGVLDAELRVTRRP